MHRYIMNNFNNSTNGYTTVHKIDPFIQLFPNTVAYIGSIQIVYFYCIFITRTSYDLIPLHKYFIIL